MMMTKLNQPQTASWKYWLAMPFLLALVFALNIQTAQAQVVEENPDEMPYYGDCEAIAKEERQACTMKGLIQDLYSNIKYPESAQKEGKEGKVFVEFYIDKSGKVTNAKVLKGFHPDCDAEALRAINNLKDWSPGKKEGKPILVKMVLPVAFKLA